MGSNPERLGGPRKIIATAVAVAAGASILAGCAQDYDKDTFTISVGVTCSEPGSDLVLDGPYTPEDAIDDSSFGFKLVCKEGQPLEPAVLSIGSENIEVHDNEDHQLNIVIEDLSGTKLVDGETAGYASSHEVNVTTIGNYVEVVLRNADEVTNFNLHSRFDVE